LWGFFWGVLGGFGPPPPPPPPAAYFWSPHLKPLQGNLQKYFMWAMDFGSIRADGNLGLGLRSLACFPSSALWYSRNPLGPLLSPTLRFILLLEITLNCSSFHVRARAVTPRGRIRTAERTKLPAFDQKTRRWDQQQILAERAVLDRQQPKRHARTRVSKIQGCFALGSFLVLPLASGRC
jgi:hypothetical protein